MDMNPPARTTTLPAGRSTPATATARFLYWAARTPQAPAIRETGRIWRYAELAGAAAGIADAIRQAGCRPGDVVAIDGQRGGDFVAALLGIFLARCVALPFDPGQPLAWCQAALQEANAALLLRCGDARPARIQCPSLAVETPVASIPADGIAPPTGEPSRDAPALDDPAYLFFTSGTTGRPKGVIGTHGGLAHFLAWQRDTFAVCPADRVGHVTGLGFDVVLREIFVALTAGATLCIPDRDTLSDPREVTRWLAEEGITLLHAVPTIASVWLAEAEPAARFPALRTTFFAGEPLGRQLVLRWRERIAATAEIINLYGPTETTLAKCWYRVPRRLPFDQLPVGRPLPECDVYVLDESGTALGPGEPGEVVIRTPWRSRGYLHDPQPFRPNPIGRDPGEPVYFTGDRGQWLRDGNLALLGRLDDQLKIRGVRVEPAGVAAVLAGHPAVTACAVLAVAAPRPSTDPAWPGPVPAVDPPPSRPGSQSMLVAFVVGGANRSDLRHYLADRLADAMLPTEFHFLAELPTTANGKLDRYRLAALMADTAAGRTPTDPPQTANEQRIAAIFRELLGLPLNRPLSVRDDFFDLGGDSLQALAAVSRINHGIGGQLDVADLFEAPEIGALAERLDAIQGTVPTTAATPLRVCPRGHDLPLSPVQERIWFQCQLEGDQATAYNVPVAIDIRGRLDPATLEHALATVVTRHEVLRTTFPNRAGRAFQRIAAAEPGQLSGVDLSSLPSGNQPAEIRRLAQEQADRSFRLDRERPLRALLLRCNGDHHVLLLTVHHLAFDGWSRWLLIRELGEHYTALARGQPVTSAAAIQYADYAVWRRQSLPRPESLTYWRQRLQDAPVTHLPADFPRPLQPSFHGAQVLRHLPAPVLTEVETLAAREKTTLYMVLLTAFKLVLSRWTGATDLTVGSPVANRPHPELERLVGCFIEMLPVRTTLAGLQTCVEALRLVRSEVIAAFSHADVPFEKIVEHVSPPRRPGHHPLFDVMFNFVNVPQQTADPDGLHFAFADWTEPEAKFDLSVYAHRHGDGLELRLVYKTVLFEESHMVRLLDAVVNVLGQMVRRPSQPIARLQIDLDPALAATPANDPPVLPGPAPRQAAIAPRNDDEKRVAAVFRELLRRDEIAIHDDFFALGGHSLLAMQAVSRLRRLFHVDFPLRLMFNSPTVAGLAQAIRQAPVGATRLNACASPVTLSQRRMLGFMRDNPCSAHYNVPRKLRLRGGLATDLLEQAIHQVAGGHGVFATGYRLAQGVATPLPVARARIPLRQIDVGADAEPEAAADRLIGEEIGRPFPLDCGPLARALLIRKSEGEHILLLVVHHLIADCRSMGMSFDHGDESPGAWMAGVFFRDLWARYRSLLSGGGGARPALPHQFEDVARRQNVWLDGPEAARQLAQWKQLLADRPAALEVRPDFPRPPAWDFRGARLPFRVPPEQAEALRRSAREHGTTLFVVLQSVFVATLHGLSAAVDLVTGTTVGNRSGWEADELIGYFSNNLALRTRLTGDPDFHEVIRRSHEAAFFAFGHQELSFERVLQGLDIEPAADRHPLFQVRLVLHLPEDAPFAADGLSLTLEATGHEVAKYDLTLLLSDAGGALTGWLEYATSLYARDTAEAIVARYLAVLSAALTDPDRPLSALVATRQ